MKDPSLATQNAIRLLFSFLFLAVLIFSIKAYPDHPILIVSLAVLMIVLGISGLVFGLVQANRYQRVYDYEPIVFWGKNTNGKKIREIFTTFNVLGIWLGLTGIAITMLIISNLIPGK